MSQYKIQENLVYVTLTQNKICVLDESDFHLIKDYYWYAVRDGANFHAITNVVTYGIKGQTKDRHSFPYLKSFILGKVPSGMKIIHLDGNSLNCRRANLGLSRGGRPKGSKPNSFTEEEETIRIQLTNNRICLIDKNDYEKISNYRWYGVMKANERTTYVYADTAERKKLPIHQVILGKPESPLVIDHINGDGLDNRRSNLRVCTIGENLRNSRKSINNRSGFKGVSKSGVNSWVATISINGKLKNLGSYSSPEEAHLAYCRAAEEHYGSFANFGQ